MIDPRAFQRKAFETAINTHPALSITEDELRLPRGREGLHHLLDIMIAIGLDPGICTYNNCNARR